MIGDDGVDLLRPLRVRLVVAAKINLFARCVARFKGAWLIFGRKPCGDAVLAVIVRKAVFVDDGLQALKQWWLGGAAYAVILFSCGDCAVFVLPDFKIKVVAAVFGLACGEVKVGAQIAKLLWGDNFRRAAVGIVGSTAADRLAVLPCFAFTKEKWHGVTSFVYSDGLLLFQIYHSLFTKSRAGGRKSPEMIVFCQRLTHISLTKRHCSAIMY